MTQQATESNPNWLRLPPFVGHQRFITKVASCKWKIFNKLFRLRNIIEILQTNISEIKMRDIITKLISPFQQEHKNKRYQYQIFNNVLPLIQDDKVVVPLLKSIMLLLHIFVSGLLIQRWRAEVECHLISEQMVASALFQD